MTPRPQVSRDDVINVPELLARCLGNVEIAERVLNKFSDRFGSDLCDLQRGLTGPNLELISQAAHRIKGSSANVSAHRLCDLATEIEQLARLEQTEEISRYVEELHREWERFDVSSASRQLTDQVPR